MPDRGTKPAVVSLFSGAGGLDLGFVQAGFNVVWANDSDRDACETHRRNFGAHVVRGDVREISASDIPDCDLVIGGPPCQGFSISGKMDQADPRNRLLWEFHRIVTAKKPRWFVMENVPNLGTNPRFGIVLDDFLAAFKDAGWHLWHQVLDGSAHGVPQSRKRFFLVGTVDGPDRFSFPEPLPGTVSVREALRGLPLPGTGINQGVCRAKIEIASNPSVFRSPYTGMLFNGRSGRPLDPDRPAGTLLASGGNQTPIIEQNLLDDPKAESWVGKLHSALSAGEPLPVPIPPFIRRLTLRELARLQGFPDDFEFSGPQTSCQAQIGNSVPPPLSRRVAERVLAGMLDAASVSGDSVLSFF